MGPHPSPRASELCVERRGQAGGGGVLLKWRGCRGGPGLGCKRAHTGGPWAQLVHRQVRPERLTLARRWTDRHPGHVP